MSSAANVASRRGAPIPLTSIVGPTISSVTVVPWIDPDLDVVGHDPRSLYVERFWLGILGPSSTWLLRRLAAEFDEAPDGFVLCLPETARALGLTESSARHSPFTRSIVRLVQFGLLRPGAGEVLEARRRVPPLTFRQVAKLPDFLNAEHREWERRHHADHDEIERARAWRLALTLVELGEDAAAVERQLVEWRFATSLAHEMASWAVRYRRPEDAA